MSTVSPLKSAADVRSNKSILSALRGFFGEVWHAFERQSELQMMLSSGYTQGLSKAANARKSR